MIPEPAFSHESRGRYLERLRNSGLDVLIIGGGINGAGVARDLALRSTRLRVPLRVALVEQGHFASGTSGKNSQLIHGGLRYLKQLEFRLVREALRERATLLELAPHLVEPLPFLIPFYGLGQGWFYGTGLWLYHLLAGSRSLERPRFFSARELERLEPGLARTGLRGGGIFYDARVHSARFLLENLFDAARWGAMAVNYTRAEDVSSSGATLVDLCSGTRFSVRARKVVDATGPWECTRQLRLVRGSHIIVPRLNASEHAVAFFEREGRIVFVIPWGSRRQLSLVGTTDCDHAAGPDSVRISRAEVDYLLGILRRLYPGVQSLEPIAAFSSLRALLRDESESATETSREHRIWNSADGILHIAGGKYTTYRAMSEEASDLVVREIAPRLKGRCFTAEVPLGGNTRERIAELHRSAPEMAACHGLFEEEMELLVSLYGVQVNRILAQLGDEDPTHRTAFARLRFAIRHEMALRLADFLFVSTYLGYEQKWTPAGLAAYAAIMGRELGWDQGRTAAEVQSALQVASAPSI